MLDVCHAPMHVRVGPSWTIALHMMTVSYARMHVRVGLTEVSINMKSGDKQTAAAAVIRFFHQ